MLMAQWINELMIVIIKEFSKIFKFLRFDNLDDNFSLEIIFELKIFLKILSNIIRIKYCLITSYFDVDYLQKSISNKFVFPLNFIFIESCYFIKKSPH